SLILGNSILLFRQELSVPATYDFTTNINRDLIRIGIDNQRQRMLPTNLELECIFLQIRYIIDYNL
uniref:hypothetical protein n=1 Tax=Alistipes shahii TaxID=328814 RepID=UPI003FEE65C5